MYIWLAEQSDDHDCYNFIAKTKKELMNLVKENCNNKYKENRYKEVWKIQLDTSNLFQLIDDLLGEGGGKNSAMGKRINHYVVNKNFSLSEVPFNTHIDFDGNLVEDRKINL